MKQKIIYILSIIATILAVLLFVFLKEIVFAKQEPIQEILNQIELNESELQQLEIKKSELNQGIEDLKSQLNQYGVQLAEKESEFPTDYSFQPILYDENGNCIGGIGCTKEDREPGMLNESGDTQLMPEIGATTEHERFKELASAYGLDASQIWNVENYYGIREGVILCITVAETSGGNRGAGGKNIGSVGSNDRGDRPTYALMESGLEAIGKTLNNQYLGKKQTLGCLSNAGSCTEQNDNGKRYATSESSREKNMVACLSTIYGNINASEFSIRR